MSRKHKPRQEVYAVVRVDQFHSPDTPWEHRITVKEVVTDAGLAQAEVDRLNALNKDKGCVYFKQMTRLFAEGESAGREI
jgi:hypothetical protein